MIEICWVLSARQYINLVVNMFTEVSAYSTKHINQSSTIRYLQEIDFSACYESETLGEDIKNDLKKIEDYISKHEDYTLDDLDKVVGKIEEDNKTLNIAPASIDYTKYLPVNKDQLNSKEKEIFNQHPTWGVFVLLNADYANTWEKNFFGSNTWGTNGDAYRHSVWNALGAQTTSSSYMASFATAHETGSPDYNPNSIDTKMDLQNNAKGRELLKSISLPSRPPNAMTIPYIIRNEIANAVKDGKMVRFIANGKKYNYLMKTNSSSKN